MTMCPMWVTICHSGWSHIEVIGR